MERLIYIRQKGSIIGSYNTRLPGVNENVEHMQINLRTGFLYCPRCGLRKPKSEIQNYYSGFCPVCGCRMIEEMYLPYTSGKTRYNIIPPTV